MPKYVWALAALPNWLTDSATSYLPGKRGEEMRKLSGFHRSMAYYWVQQLRPQQLAPGLTDSPVGLLSWLSFFWGLHLDVTPTFNAEMMLTICTVYFVTRYVLLLPALKHPLARSTYLSLPSVPSARPSCRTITTNFSQPSTVTRRTMSSMPRSATPTIRARSQTYPTVGSSPLVICVSTSKASDARL